MKKFLLLVIVFFISVIMFAQVRIPMEKDGGVYKIPCLINGARMKMIFDTGASKVSMSLTMAEYLFENDYLTMDDIKGVGNSRVADGSIHENYIINIKNLEIGGLHLENVEAWISKSQTAPLLLGQSAIQKLGPVTIEGNTLIVNNAVEEYDEDSLVSLKLC